MHHHVGPQRERLLQVRRRERVVHHEQRAAGWAASARARMSAMPSSGFVGVSAQTTAVFLAASCSRTAATSEIGTTRS